MTDARGKVYDYWRKDDAFGLQIVLVDMEKGLQVVRRDKSPCINRRNLYEMLI